MKVSKITPELGVKDVNASVEFYKSVLGFELKMSVPEEGVLDWALIESDGCQIMLERLDALANEIEHYAGKSEGGASLLYMETGNLQEAHDRINGRAQILKEPHQTFYGAKEMAFKDPDGYIIVVSERN